MYCVKMANDDDVFKIKLYCNNWCSPNTLKHLTHVYVRELLSDFIIRNNAHQLCTEHADVLVMYLIVSFK